MAKDADPPGEFVWMIQDRVVPSTKPVQNFGTNEYQQSLLIVPSLDSSPFSVTCQYLQKDPSSNEVVFESSTGFNAKVIVKKFPPVPFKGGKFKEGDKAVLTVPFELFPAPSENEIEWEIQNGDDIVSLKPGTSKRWIL